MTLDNEQTSLLIMEVEFYFERYRMDPVASKTLKYRQKQPSLGKKYNYELKVLVTQTFSDIVYK